MKTTSQSLRLPASALFFSALVVNANASGDYAPAIWNPNCGQYYTTGNGHKFAVIHDMEGYYLSTISYFKNCATTASVFYCVNGKQDASSDAGAGELTQMVAEANYAWHVRCWNTYCLGTEHEGFAGNPAWYTEAMYQTSAGLQRHLADKFGLAKDRNHIVGHNEWQNSAWRTYASANFGIDPNCNSHTDPGANWNWSHFMDLILQGGVVNPPFYFDTSVQGWVAGNGSSALAWQGCCGWPGVAYADQTGSDMFWYSPSTSVAGGGDVSVNVQVYPQSGTSSSHQIQAFWKTAAENYFDAAKSTPKINYTAQNGWYSVNLSMNSTKYLGQSVNQYRLDFDDVSSGTRFLINHFYPQTVPRYYFNSTVEGWTGSPTTTGPVWEGCCGWPGVLWGDQSGNDGYFVSPAFNFLGANNDVVKVRVYPQNGNTANHDMKVYWKTSAENFFSEDKSSAVVNYTAQNAWATVTLNVGPNGKWGANFITQLRVDVDATYHANRWVFDSIMIDHQ